MALNIEGDIYTQPTRYRIDHAGEFELPALAIANENKLPIVMFRAAAQHLADTAEELTKIDADDGLSDAGKARKRDPLQRELITKIAEVDGAVDIEEKHWQSQEAELLRVPYIEMGNTVAAVEDREIRDWWRSQSVEERTKLMERMKTEPGNERLMIAMLRSPIPQLDHEVTYMRSLWNQSARLNNPGKAAEIEVGRAQVEWARRGINTIGGLTQKVLRMEKKSIAEVLLADGGRLTSKAGLFAVPYQQMEYVKQIAEQRAKLAAARG